MDMLPPTLSMTPVLGLSLQAQFAPAHTPISGQDLRLFERCVNAVLAPPCRRCQWICRSTAISALRPTAWTFPLRVRDPPSRPHTEHLALYIPPSTWLAQAHDVASSLQPRALDRARTPAAWTFDATANRQTKTFVSHLQTSTQPLERLFGVTQRGSHLFSPSSSLSTVAFCDFLGLY